MYNLFEEDVSDDQCWYQNQFNYSEPEKRKKTNEKIPIPSLPPRSDGDKKVFLSVMDALKHKMHQHRAPVSIMEQSKHDKTTSACAASSSGKGQRDNNASGSIKRDFSNSFMWNIGAVDLAANRFYPYSNLPLQLNSPDIAPFCKNDKSHSVVSGYRSNEDHSGSEVLRKYDYEHMKTRMITGHETGSIIDGTRFENSINSDDGEKFKLDYTSRKRKMNSKQVTTNNNNNIFSAMNNAAKMRIRNIFIDSDDSSIGEKSVDCKEERPVVEGEICNLSDLSDNEGTYSKSSYFLPVEHSDVTISSYFK